MPSISLLGQTWMNYKNVDPCDGSASEHHHRHAIGDTVRQFDWPMAVSVAIKGHQWNEERRDGRSRCVTTWNSASADVATWWLSSQHAAFTTKTRTVATWVSIVCFSFPLMKNNLLFRSSVCWSLGTSWGPESAVAVFVLATKRDLHRTSSAEFSAGPKMNWISMSSTLKSENVWHKCQLLPLEDGAAVWTDIWTFLFCFAETNLAKKDKQQLTSWHGSQRLGIGN